MRTRLAFFFRWSIIVLSMVASPVLAASLASLKAASCELSALSRADIEACAANPTCLANEEIGAYLRNGGATSKLAKMCDFRVDNWIAACTADKAKAARFVALGARSAMENWIDQSVQYCQRGQMSCAHVIARFGAAWISEADFAGTRAAARNHIWALAEGLPQQASVEPVALSILAELYNRLDAPTACAAD